MADQDRPADYHGPKETYDKAYPAHKSAHDTAEHLLNGRVTHPGARRVLREALDHADKSANPTGKPGADQAVDRAVHSTT